jgi:hypothetical protein
MLVLLFACSASPPAAAPSAGAAPAAADEKPAPFAGPGPAPIPTAADTTPSLLGLSPPTSRPAPPLKTTVCPEWSGQFEVPAGLTLVECGAGRAAMTGRGVVAESCAAVQAGLRAAGWVDVAEGEGRYALSQGERRASLVCTEIPGGVLVTLTGA